MIAKLLCYFLGHKRRKRVSASAVGDHHPVLRCPRCGDEKIARTKAN